MESITKLHGATPAMRQLAQEQLAQDMAAHIAAASSHAEALRALRTAFPGTPLPLRVAALAMVARPPIREQERRHIPR